MTTYTPAQLAEQLQVSRGKIMAWVHAGQLRAVDVGAAGVRRFRITEDALTEFLDARRVQPAARRGPHRTITRRTTKDYFQ